MPQTATLTPAFDEAAYQRKLTQQRRQSRELACEIARIAEEFRGNEIIVLDLTSITPITDYFVIATGNNPRQIAALAEEVRIKLKQRGQFCPPPEGIENSSWVLQDFGNVVLHVFLPAARTLYDLEGLWADAPRVTWSPE